MKTWACALLAAGAVLVWAQSMPQEPAGETGKSVTGAFEGWFKNPDGTFNLLLGYYNRNQKQDLDIPIGPENRIEPGGPDRGQPTHFNPGRAWGLFVVKVPANFGDTKITWTLTANGRTTAIPAGLNPDYEISPLVEAAVGNTPPVLGFDAKGPTAQGPQGITAERTAKVGSPLAVTVWASDDAKFTNSSNAKPKNPGPAVRLKWIKFRGPGEVKFANTSPEFEKTEGPAAFNGKATTMVTFSEPGDYVLHVTANDYSGEGGAGFQCCWSTGQVRVAVQK